MELRRPLSRRRRLTPHSGATVNFACAMLSCRSWVRLSNTWLASGFS